MLDGGDDDTSDEEMDLTKPPGQTLVRNPLNRMESRVKPTKSEDTSQRTKQRIQTPHVESNIFKGRAKNLSRATNIEERSPIKGISRPSNMITPLPGSSIKANKRKLVIESESSDTGETHRPPGRGEKPAKRRRKGTPHDYNEEKEMEKRAVRMNNMFGHNNSN
jgi:hypothetical protein